MEITNVKIFRAKKHGAVLAYANVILDNHFIIRGITLLETKKNGRFISMPSRLLQNTNKRAYRDICHPLNNEIRSNLTDTVFNAYDKFIEEQE